MHAFARLFAAAACVALAVPAAQAQPARRLSQVPNVAPGSPAGTAAGAAAGRGVGGTAVPTELFPADAAPGTGAPGVAPPATTLGVPGRAAAFAAGSVPASAVSCGSGATDAVRAFLFADGNQDCQLTRAEAGLLGSAAPRSFEDMDRDADGLVTRAEFDTSLR